MFKVSGIRANYPQFFFKDEDGSFTFIGQWETIEGFNENSQLPGDILEANPQIDTWEKMFGSVV